MDAFVEVAVFLVLPYAAFVALVAGVAYRLYQWLVPRGRTGLASVALVPNTFGSGDVAKDVARRMLVFYTLPKMEKDRTLVVGTMMFHYGIWAVLLFHLGLIVPLPISSQLHYALGFYIGGAAGLLTLAGMVVLLARRVGRSEMRRTSVLDDYFAMGLLLLVVSFGLVQTLVIQPNYLDTVAPWLVSILTFHPNLNPIAGVGLFTILHVALALVFIAYLPYGKMGHVVAYLFNPTITGPNVRVAAGQIPSAPVGAASGRR